MSQSVSATQDSTGVWQGPFVGFNSYGEADHTFVRCSSCGVEVTTGTPVESVIHREDCEVEA